jgi:phosphoribosylaminoimidazole-succinocarboxamide synthase
LTATRAKLHEGKAKIVWKPGVEDEATLAGAQAGLQDGYIVEFKDDATAFDGKKRGRIGDKGRCNNLISAALFEVLEGEGVPTHFLGVLGEREMLVRRLDIIPVEVVVRNVAAGSLAKRLGLDEGTTLVRPVLELYYKNDALGDPLVNRFHVRVMGWASDTEIDRIEGLALRVNEILGRALADCGLRLVDFKLEFGRTGSGEVILGDEISPDTCRLWDLTTNERLDKDRFRRDMGGVEEAYAEVWRRVSAATAKWKKDQVARPSSPPRPGGGTAPAAAVSDAAAMAPAVARVFVTLKKTVLDPQGAAVENALKTLGYGEIVDVRVGKFIVLELKEATPERVAEMCRRLLANPVIEDYCFEILPWNGAGQ